MEATITSRILAHKSHKTIFFSLQSQIVEQKLPSFHHPSLTPTNNTMVRDLPSSHLHIASCFEDGEDSNSEIMMKRPLIVATQSSDASSLEAEEQQTRLKGKEKGLVREAFLIGSAITCVLQVMCVAICYAIYFLFGYLVGFWWSRWIIVNYLHIGITVLSMPSWRMIVVVHIALFVILTKCFHWGHHYVAGEEEEEEEEEEDDPFFASMFV
jgi:hypothetical protein